MATEQALTEQALTAWQAIAALAPLIGGGGLTAILVAYLSYRRAQSEGRQGDSGGARFGIGALLADSTSINRLSLALEAIDVHFAKALLFAEQAEDNFSKKFEAYIDEIRRLRRAVEDLQSRSTKRSRS